MKSNNSMARSVATIKATRLSWLIFDNLPHSVRVALWEAPVSINPISARILLIQSGEDGAVFAIRDACRQEIDLFSAEHIKRHGGALPHVAAGVSLQEYEPAQKRALRQAR